MPKFQIDEQKVFLWKEWAAILATSAVIALAALSAFGILKLD
jgi:hypothetical protein